jgi:AraC family transcriptional regulator
VRISDVRVLDALESPTGLRFLRLDYPASAELPTHAHADDASLNLCLEGSVGETVGRVSRVFGPSSLSLMPAGIPHANRFARGTRVFLVVLTAPWRARAGGTFPVLDASRHWEAGRPIWLATRLCAEFRRPTGDAGRGPRLDELFGELLGELSRDYAPGAPADAPEWFRRATDYLRDHFTRPLTVAEVAAVAGVHPTHLMKRFPRYAGCTVGGFVRRLRVEYAAHALVTTEIPLGQVAREAGFVDQSHLTRAFKGQTGDTPGAYRAARAADAAR